MVQRHKVSVIIPVYGVEKYIERCARSLFEQTLDDIEFIFVDDCTPDRSMAILAQLIEEYRLRFAEMNYVVRTERMPTNSGLPAVRRHGLQLATGDYIIHCDSDDWVEPKMLEFLYSAGIRQNADMVVCNFYMDKASESIEYKNNHSSDYVGSFLHENISWNVWTKLVRRSMYDSDFVYPKKNMAEDMLISLQCLLRSKKVAFIDDCLYHYIVNPQSITNERGERKAIARYEASKENIDKALLILEERGYNGIYPQGITQLKYHARRHLIPLINSNEIYNLWKNTYPEINKRFMFNAKIRLSTRIQFLIIYLKIYKICPFFFK